MASFVGISQPITLTSLDATLDRSPQHLGGSPSKTGSFFNKALPVLMRAMLQVAPVMRRTHDRQSAATDMICDSIHFTFPALSRWKVVHTELNAEPPGEGQGERIEKTTFGRASSGGGACPV